MMLAMWLIAFPGIRYNPHSFVFSSSKKFILHIPAFSCFVRTSYISGHCEQAFRYSSEKMATRITRNHKEMLGVTVKGTMNNGANTKVRRTPTFKKFQWLWNDPMTANTASL